MNTTHRIVLNEAYIAEAQRKAIAENTVMRLLYQKWWPRWLPRVFLAVGIIYSLLNDFGTLALMMGGLLALSIISEITGRMGLAKARKRVRFVGSTTTVLMSDQGVEVTGPESQSRLNWPVVLTPIIYPDGVAIKLSRASVLWLPDNALTEGSADDVRRLLVKHVNTGTS